MNAHILTQYQSEYHVWMPYCKNCGAEGIALSAPCPGDKLSNLVKEHVLQGSLKKNDIISLDNVKKALDLGKERS